MKVVIPSDWDGEYRCVQIYWPDSVQWLAILHGLLSQCMRGRLWDETTGSVIAAQEVGQEIWYRNTPLAECEVVQQTEVESAAQIGGIVTEIEGMGQVVTEVRIVDGKLRVYYGHCCYEDVADLSVLGEFDIEGDAPDAPPLPPDIDPPPGEIGLTQCGKAEWLINRIEDIGRAAWGSRLSPYEIQAAIRSANPGYTVGLDACYSLWVVTSGMSLIELVTDADIFNAEFLRAWKCYALKLLDSPEDEFEQTEFSMFATYPVQFALFSENPDLGTAFDTYVSNFWQVIVFNVLGRERVNQIMEESAGYTGDCAHCDEPIAGEAYEWDIYYDFSTDQHGTGGTAPGEGTYEPGVGYTSDDDDYVRFNTDQLGEVSGHLKRIRIEYSMSEADGTEENAAIKFKRPGDDPELVSYAEMRANAGQGYIDKQVSVYYGVGSSDTVRLQVQMREGGTPRPTITITGLRASGDGDPCIPEATA